MRNSDLPVRFGIHAIVALLVAGAALGLALLSIHVAGAASVDQASLTIKVTDADTGRPLGLHIAVEYYDPVSGWRLLHWIRADAAGKATLFSGLAPGEYRFTTDTFYHMPLVTTVTFDGVTPVTVEMILEKHPQTWWGLVTDASTGLPIVGAEVRIGGVPSSAWTNEHGEYMFHIDMEPGVYPMKAWTHRYSLLEKNVTASGAAPVRQDFALQRMPRIAAGIVKDAATGAPIEGADISAEQYLRGEWHPVGLVKTDASGAYELYLDSGPGKYLITGWAHRWEAPHSYVAKQTTVTFDGVNAIEADFALTKAPIGAFGTVKDAVTGAPLAFESVMVEFFCPVRNTWLGVDSASVESDGSYRLFFNRGPGTYIVGVAWGTGRYANSTARLTFNGTTAIRQDFSLSEAGFGFSLASTADPPRFAAVGDVINFTFVLNNFTEDILTGPFTVTEDTSGAILGTSAASRLAPGESTTIVARHRVTRDDIRTKGFKRLVSGHASAGMGTVTTNQVFHEVGLAPSPPARSVGGATRFDTAVAVSRAAWPRGLDPEGARTVIVATGRNWPDALGASALAGVVDGPILLVDTSAVPSAVMAEITRLKADKAIIVGGTGAVDMRVENALRAALGSKDVRRIAGVDRYETANRIAAEVRRLQGAEFDGVVFVATGADFPDSAAAAPVAAAEGWPIYLVHPTKGMSSSTRSAMEGLNHAYVLGGTGAVSKATEDILIEELPRWGVTRWGGANRYKTATNIAGSAIARGAVWNRVGITTGENFSDALVGGVYQAKMNSVMLLTPPNTLHPSPASFLSQHASRIDSITFYGGLGAVSQSVRNRALQLVAD